MGDEPLEDYLWRRFRFAIISDASAGKIAEKKEQVKRKAVE